MAAAHAPPRAAIGLKGCRAWCDRAALDRATLPHPQGRLGCRCALVRSVGDSRWLFMTPVERYYANLIFLSEEMAVVLDESCAAVMEGQFLAWHLI
jgi:hypothetical protein